MSNERTGGSNADLLRLYSKIEERLEMLEGRLSKLAKEVDVIKRSIRNDILRYEIEEVKRGKGVESIIH